MGVNVGDILTGKVTGITKFGAFVSLEGNESGMVHISEISTDYVKDINDHIKLNDQVEVLVLNIDEKNRISLSIRKAAEKKKPVPKQSLDDMLSKFMTDSNDRIASLKKPDNRRRGGHKGSSRKYDD